MKYRWNHFALLSVFLAVFVDACLIDKDGVSGFTAQPVIVLDSEKQTPKLPDKKDPEIELRPEATLSNGMTYIGDQSTLEGYKGVVKKWPSRKIALESAITRTKAKVDGTLYSSYRLIYKEPCSPSWPYITFEEFGTITQKNLDDEFGYMEYQRINGATNQVLHVRFTSSSFDSAFLESCGHDVLNLSFLEEIALLEGDEYKWATIVAENYAILAKEAHFLVYREPLHAPINLLYDTYCAPLVPTPLLRLHDPQTSQPNLIVADDPPKSTPSKYHVMAVDVVETEIKSGDGTEAEAFLFRKESCSSSKYFWSEPLNPLNMDIFKSDTDFGESFGHLGICKLGRQTIHFYQADSRKDRDQQWVDDFEKFWKVRSGKFLLKFACIVNQLDYHKYVRDNIMCWDSNDKAVQSWNEFLHEFWLDTLTDLAGKPFDIQMVGIVEYDDELPVGMKRTKQKVEAEIRAKKEAEEEAKILAKKLAEEDEIRAKKLIEEAETNARKLAEENNMLDKYTAAHRAGNREVIAEMERQTQVMREVYKGVRKVHERVSEVHKGVRGVTEAVKGAHSGANLPVSLDSSINKKSGTSPDPSISMSDGEYGYSASDMSD
jgi:hypothetical protein